MRAAAVLGLVGALLALGACGDDDSSSSSPSLEDYCQLVDDLNAVAEEELGGLGPDASQADFNALYARVITEHEDDLERLEEVAPTEIRDDVVELNRLTREAIAAEDLSLLEGGDGAEISDRIHDFESESCPSDSG